MFHSATDAAATEFLKKLEICLQSNNSFNGQWAIQWKFSRRVRKSGNQSFDQLITKERVIKLVTYCSMSQYFMSPSFPELTIKPASFFPFTIINFSLTHSTLKQRQTRTFDNRILLLKIGQPSELCRFRSIFPNLRDFPGDGFFFWAF